VFTAPLHSNGRFLVFCFEVFACQEVYTPQFLQCISTGIYSEILSSKLADRSHSDGYEEFYLLGYKAM
jgi:hypothetical protein